MDDNAGNASPRKKPHTRCIFWLLCALTLLSLIVATNRLVVFTWFHRVPPVLLVQSCYFAGRKQDFLAYPDTCPGLFYRYFSVLGVTLFGAP